MFISQDSPEIKELRRKFRPFYLKELRPKFGNLESARKRYVRYGYYLVFPCYILIGIFHKELLSFLLSMKDTNIVEAFMYLLFAPWLLTSIPEIFYKKKSQVSIMPEFIKYFDGFKYSHEKNLPKDMFEKSLIAKPLTSLSGSLFVKIDDYFEGSYKGVDVAILEVYNGKKDCFQGLIITFKMNKSFRGQTVGFEEKGLLNKLISKNDLEKVNLEDIDFENAFEVYSSDQIEARYLLTPAFMERLLRLEHSFSGQKVQFSFFDEMLFLMLSIDGDLFNCTSLFNSTDDSGDIYRTLDQFLAILSIVDVLKLNQRIVM